jgi:integrase
LVDDAFVFSADGDGSTPWLPNRVTKTFLAYLRRAGVGRFRLHDLRHFMATQMLAHGVAVVTVSQRLGHARASTTLNVYGHCIPGADHDAACFISNLVLHRGPAQGRTSPGMCAFAAIGVDAIDFNRDCRR